MWYKKVLTALLTCFAFAAMFPVQAGNVNEHLPAVQQSSSNLVGAIALYIGIIVLLVVIAIWCLARQHRRSFR